MKFDYENENLRRLAEDARYTMGLPREAVKKYRMRLQVIHSAIDERAFYSQVSWHFEKLKGDLEGKYSFRLNDQWRLIVRFEKNEDGKTVVIVSVVDYH